MKTHLFILFFLSSTFNLFSQHRLTDDSFKIAQNSANQGDKNAQFILGMHYLSYSDKGIFQEKARKWLKRSADQGLKEAQYEYAKEIYREKTPKHDRVALEYFEKSARQGHYKSALQAAEMYYFGFGTLKFPNRAFNLFKLCAENGDAKAQYYTALMLFSGEGIEKNRTQAFIWCGKSSNQNFAPAQLLLAKMYMSGSGTSADYNKAAKLTMLAYENGETEAEIFWDSKQLWNYLK